MQTEAAVLLQLDGRTVRRWIEGTRPTPNVVIEHFRGLVDALDQTAQAITRKMGVPGLLLLCRRDRDVWRAVDRGTLRESFLPPRPKGQKVNLVEISRDTGVVFVQFPF
jgi:hypothetical protein